MNHIFECIQCHAVTTTSKLVLRCPHCRAPVQIKSTAQSLLDLARLGLTEISCETEATSSRNFLQKSGVWRFKDAVANFPEEKIISFPEGNTPLIERKNIALDLDLTYLKFKHEGMNPTGSFKDRGMTVAVSHANSLGAKLLMCASTGNTSSSLAAYGAIAGIPTVVFLPGAKVSAQKTAQTKAYGARIIAVNGSFDNAMRLIEQLSAREGVYPVNSINPFRIEGQKTIIWEMLSQLNWEAPDFIVVPGGNLGNTSAFGKALNEAYQAGLIIKKPRLITVQAAGASPFEASYQNNFSEIIPIEPSTLATAIQIGNPVNFTKAREAILSTVGIVTRVTDEEIYAAKKTLDSLGIGCEPASAATLAGIVKLRQENKIPPGSRIVAVLTGHILKDLTQSSSEQIEEYDESSGIAVLARRLGIG